MDLVKGKDYSDLLTQHMQEFDITTAMKCETLQSQAVYIHEQRRDKLPW